MLLNNEESHKTSCSDGNHIEGLSCISNEKSCNVSKGAGKQTWDGNNWGGCRAVSCKTGFSLLNGKCEQINSSSTSSDSYPGCDTNDIILSDTIILAACNVGASVAGTGTESYGNYYQFGRNDNVWLDRKNNSILTNTSWGVAESEKDTATYGNSTTEKQLKMKGPCASGYHVPTNKEWTDIISVGGWGKDYILMSNELKLPFAGFRYWNADFVYIASKNEAGHFWSSSPHSYGNSYMMTVFKNHIESSNHDVLEDGHSVRCLKN